MNRRWWFLIPWMLLSSDALAQTTLRVLTWEAWCGEFTSQTPDRDARVERMPEELARLDADLLVLQGLWHNASRRELIRALEARGYTHSLNPNGVVESGLLVLSRLPLSPLFEQWKFTSQSKNDRRLGRSKSALFARVWMPEFGNIPLVTAQFAELGFDAASSSFSVEEHRVQQEQQSEFARELESRLDPAEFSLRLGAFEAHPWIWSRGAYTSVLTREVEHLHSMGWLDAFRESNRGQFTWLPENPYNRTNPGPARVLDAVWYRPHARIVETRSYRVLGEVERPLARRAGILTEFKIWE
jgi:hypothetical protein